MAVEWERVGQPGFDRIVEALAHRVYDAAARVEVVNGRGGDDGIDIKVSHGTRVRIFQLKYYLDGFPTTAHKGRRKSIKQSFTRALQHQPWEWILVVPCTLTTAEREFVTSLAAGQAVRVEVWDRAKLDGLLATHADLEVSFTRDQLFEAAKVYGQERALLMDGVRDVSARVTALGRQADGLDDHWTVDFARQGKTVVHTLRAKHPRAHEVSPVEITLTGNGPLAPDLAQAVRRSLGFGLPEEVVLPGEAVESLTALQEAAQLRSYIEDLEAVQRHCVTPADRIALRMARLPIQGHCVSSPIADRRAVAPAWLTAMMVGCGAALAVVAAWSALTFWVSSGGWEWVCMAKRGRSSLRQRVAGEAARRAAAALRLAQVPPSRRAEPPSVGPVDWERLDGAAQVSVCAAECRVCAEARE